MFFHAKVLLKHNLIRFCKQGVVATYHVVCEYAVESVAS